MAGGTPANSVWRTRLPSTTLRDGLAPMKIIIILFLLVIVGSLASALFYLVRDKGGSDRTVKALTIRVGLSVGLFLLLLLGYYLGLIPKQGL